MGMELARGQMASQAIQRGTSEEILEVLQTIMKRIDERSLNVQSSQPVAHKMESLQMVRTYPLYCICKLEIHVNPGTLRSNFARVVGLRRISVGRL